MAEQVFLSICIPAYKRADYLKRLLDSILIQSFRDFEVIVTDDSPDGSVETLCLEYKEKYPIQYFRNIKPLGAPENWNEGIRRAAGQWIKLMHDDDWFGDEHSLNCFLDEIRANPSASFIFCAYRNIHLETGGKKEIFAPKWRRRMLERNPVTLFSKNIIGPPSAVLHRRNSNVSYDVHLKWLVDIDFYVQFLANSKSRYCSRVLVNIGVGEQQVTRASFRNRPIEIPENFYLLNKVGVENLSNILVYDAWWRLIRNLGIRKSEDIAASGYNSAIPLIILSMINFQAKLPVSLLRIGLASKVCMSICYVIHINKIKS
ncbi:MAG TPA: glycosyltransferase family 2 protein [Puia sp.]|nr:glycosyltransferase family 2 protein [Puia sp.]